MSVDDRQMGASDEIIEGTETSKNKGNEWYRRRYSRVIYNSLATTLSKKFPLSVLISQISSHISFYLSPTLGLLSNYPLFFS